MSVAPQKNAIGASSAAPNQFLRIGLCLNSARFGFAPWN
jgi:hypothetical protein